MPHHKGQKKEEWIEALGGARYTIYSEGIFSENAKQIPVIIFINKKTAEMKFFARKLAEEIGTKNLKL